MDTTGGDMAAVPGWVSAPFWRSCWVVYLLGDFRDILF